MKYLFSLFFAVCAGWAYALEPGADGYYHTGDGIQTAAHWPFTRELFSIANDTKAIPGVKTRQAMIELEADKKLTLKMLQEVDVEQLKTGLAYRYRVNGYKSAEPVRQFLTALQGAALPTGATIVIAYHAQSKTTTLEGPSGSPSTIEGVDFMRATWSIWFGASKPADLGDQLLSKL